MASYYPGLLILLIIRKYFVQSQNALTVLELLDAYLGLRHEVPLGVLVLQVGESILRQTVHLVYNQEVNQLKVQEVGLIVA